MSFPAYTWREDEIVPQPFERWTPEIGPVDWFWSPRFPASYFGTPLDDAWPGTPYWTWCRRPSS